MKIEIEITDDKVKKAIDLVYDSMAEYIKQRLEEEKRDDLIKVQYGRNYKRIFDEPDTLKTLAFDKFNSIKGSLEKENVEEFVIAETVRQVLNNVLYNETRTKEEKEEFEKMSNKE